VQRANPPDTAHDLLYILWTDATRKKQERTQTGIESRVEIFTKLHQQKTQRITQQIKEGKLKIGNAD
jgi:hypothetical protein